MAGRHLITINGQQFTAQRGELLLDAALNNGVDLPFNCRAGHCGTCCVRVVSGSVHGGDGSEPGVVHACQCRIAGDVVVERRETSSVRAVDGVLTSLRAMSPDVMEVGITTDRALPHHAGQYAQLQFDGFPGRPFSLTHPVAGSANGASMWFHIRRMGDGHVTSSLGTSIRPGHRVRVSGPFGSAHFRPNLNGRLILVGTSTGFAPIWSVATAALRENPKRMMMVIAGGRSIQSLYMGPALALLARFPNVFVVAACSSPQHAPPSINFGRPTDFLPRLLPSDVLFTCGAPGMVESVKAIASRHGATCYADPFMQSAPQSDLESNRASSMRARVAHPRQRSLRLPFDLKPERIVNADA